MEWISFVLEIMNNVFQITSRFSFSISESLGCVVEVKIKFVRVFIDGFTAWI